MKTWTPEEDEILKKYKSTRSNKEIQTLLPSKTIYAIKNRMFKIGLQRTPEELTNLSCGKFQKGQQPWNKGKKGLKIGGEAGQFKKGNIPHNANKQGDGAIELRRYNASAQKIYYIRVALGKWKALHRHIWEQANGEIPQYHIVVFKDGNPLNCTLENLELITRKENYIRNAGIRDLKDEAVIRSITRNKQLQKEIAKHPELISIKRKVLKIKRQIKNGSKTI